jgi:hypothetical protein
MSTPDLTSANFNKLLYSLNLSNLPISTSQISVADGNGEYKWQSVFNVISTQGAIEGFPINYLPSTLVQLSNSSGTGPTGVSQGLFSWIGDGISIISPAYIQKPLNGINAWDANAYSVEGFRFGSFITFQTAQTNAECMLGFSESPEINTSYSNINYGVYLGSNGNASIVENAVVKSTIGTYFSTTQFEVRYDGHNVIY